MSMPGIVVGKDEPFEVAYRKFKKQVDRNLIVTEVKQRRYFEKPAEIKKKLKISVRKKIMKKLYTLRRYESRL